MTQLSPGQATDSVVRSHGAYDASTARRSEDEPSGHPLDQWRNGALPFLAICVQLGLGLFVVHQFQLESRSFFYVAALLAGGFVVHSLLPLRFRQALFAALSVATVFVVFGAATGAKLVGLAALLIAMCHVPVRFGIRVLLIAAVGALLAMFRAGQLAWLVRDGILPSAAWAILGSMFMFRLALYLHALRTREPDDPPLTLARTVAYFFMAPNVTFPLFPVIDYNRFAKNYYDRRAIEIYQTGAKWVVRGLLHLLLYRLVYRYFSNDVARLRDLGDLLQYMLSTYLLYLRVSGSFHLIVGVLCLFGYNLPETHHLYYLADSFNDYWRRINIYWKDFMMKLVYYPSFFRLRKLSRIDNSRALVLSTAAVFIGTWLLHSYQWFWLQGDFPIELPDLLFWGILGTLVVWNALRETKRGRQRAVSTARSSWSWSRARRVAGTFAVICILWSLWSAESAMGWLVMWRAATFVTPADLLALAALVIAGLGIAGRNWDAPAVAAGGAGKWYRSGAATSIALLVVLAASSQPAVQRLFGERGPAVIAPLQKVSLNARDAARARIGYYEKMDAKARQSIQQWDTTPQRPAHLKGFSDTEGYRTRNDFIGWDNRPSTKFPSHYSTVSINRWGFRGPDVEEAKPAGTLRIAFIGPSYIFGPGIPDSSTISAQLERRLNAVRPVAGVKRYETMNFAVMGTAITQNLALLDARAFKFSPDVVIVGIDSFIPTFVTKHLTDVVRGGIEIPYPGLERLLVECGVEPDITRGVPAPTAVGRTVARAAGLQARLPKAEIEQRIMMCDDRITEWVFGEIARTVRSHGAIPVAAAIDLIPIGVPATRPRPRRELELAAAAGFEVIDIRDAWLGRNVRELQFVPWDDHPGEFGNKLLADRIFEELRRRDVLSNAAAEQNITRQ